MSVENAEEFLASRLNAKQAAEFLGCSTSFIRRSTLDGKIAHFRVGNRIYYLKPDLLEFIKRVEPHNVNIPELE